VKGRAEPPAARALRRPYLTVILLRLGPVAGRAACCLPPSPSLPVWPTRHQLYVQQQTTTSFSFPLTVCSVSLLHFCSDEPF
jgi:hypothetical protein